MSQQISIFWNQAKPCRSAKVWGVFARPPNYGHLDNVHRNHLLSHLRRSTSPAHSLHRGIEGLEAVGGLFHSRQFICTVGGIITHFQWNAITTVNAFHRDGICQVPRLINSPNPGVQHLVSRVLPPNRIQCEARLHITQIAKLARFTGSGPITYTSHQRSDGKGETVPDQFGHKLLFRRDLKTADTRLWQDTKYWPCRT